MQYGVARHGQPCIVSTPRPERARDDEQMQEVPAPGGDEFEFEVQDQAPDTEMQDKAPDTEG